MVINLKAYYSVYQYIHVILVLSHMPTLYAIYEAAVHQLRNMDAVACWGPTLVWCYNTRSDVFAR
jgi:hypothetical protein